MLHFHYLVCERAQHADPLHGPVLLTLVCGQIHHHEEIGGVARGSQEAPPIGRPVHRALIRLLLEHVLNLCGTEPHGRGIGIEHLGGALAQEAPLFVPAATL